MFLQQKERVKDFKNIIIKYLESLVQTQQQVKSLFPGLKIKTANGLIKRQHQIYTENMKLLYWKVERENIFKWFDSFLCGVWNWSRTCLLSSCSSLNTGTPSYLKPRPSHKQTAPIRLHYPWCTSPLPAPEPDQHDSTEWDRKSARCFSADLKRSWWFLFSFAAELCSASKQPEKSS